jgi:hypothetical protein
MVTTTGPFLCKCRIEKGRIIHCKPHNMTEYALATLEYLREFMATRSMEKMSDEILKREAVLPHIDNILAKARSDTT